MGTITVTAYDATTTYKVTIGNVTVSVLGSGGTTTTVATALTAALVACTAGQFTEVAWTSSAAIITGTANTAGTPFTAASSVSGGAGTIGAYAATTANQSPNDANDAANWSLAALPTTNDVVVFNETSSIPVYWNLGSLSAVTLTGITITQAYTGTIGLQSTNSFGTAYPEYRAKYLRFDAAAGGATLNVGQGLGNGSGMIRLQLGSTGIWTGTVFNTGSSIETARQALSIHGPSTNTVFTHVGGSVGVAELAGETMTLITGNCGPAGQGAQQPNLIVSSGVTLTTLKIDQASVQLAAAATTVTQIAGLTYITGSGAITNLSVQGGSLFHQGTGTITTPKIGSGATLDFGAAGPAITTTNAIQMYAGATLNDPAFRASYAAGIVLNQCLLSDVNINIGPNRTLTPS